MDNSAIEKVLNRLGLEATGNYDNQHYVIAIEDSNEYSKMFTKLEKNAIHTEFPAIGTNTNGSTVKLTNYFELEEDNKTYMLFLIADFDKDKYYLKIGGFDK